MDAERIDRVTDWDSESFEDGFTGLRAFADRDFSGVVTDGVGWLFMLNGRIVGIEDAALEDFADANGTAYVAPHPALPLLFAMQAEGGEVRAQYYTNDTPLSEADAKLRSGKFTGYIELSENVLSGDYYTVYQGGKSLSAAFVGSSAQLKTGDEAFDLADDEVGIYKVYDVDIDVREVPDTDDVTGDTAGGTVTQATGDEQDENPGDDAAQDSTIEESNADAPATEDTDPDPDAEPDVDQSEASVGVDDEEPTVGGGFDTQDEADGAIGEDSPETTTGARNRPDEVADAAAESTQNDSGSSDGESVPSHGDSAVDSTEHGVENQGASIPNAEGDGPPPRQQSGESEPSGQAGPSGNAGPSGHAEQSESAEPSDQATPSGDDVFSQEAEWREAKSIPALDPEKSIDEADDAPGQSGSGRRPKNGPRPADSQSADGQASPAARTGDAADGSGGGGPSSAGNGESIENRPAVQRNKLERRLQRLESALEETESRREALEDERDELAAERDEYEQEVRRLESRVQELESEVGRLESELSDARAQLPDGEQSMSPTQALAETNLFVRYDSQGGPTLDDAHDGSATREQVNANLSLEHHTAFDAEDVLVNGRPFREFLRETIEFGFTRWIVEDLLYEIQETDNVGSMRDLFDAIPEIDRAEIGGDVSIVRTENGEEHREQRNFDLVLRDRMGNPLAAADLNDSRDPTQEGALESLVGDAGALAETSPSFVAAFAVTASFFEPGALEAVEDATGGGLFSRGKQKSFVKLSRKRGYHLCLVESRDGGFHLNVPEL